jgi:hypothetical protein
MFDRLCDGDTSLYRTDYSDAGCHESYNGGIYRDCELHVYAILSGQYSDQGV